MLTCLLYYDVVQLFCYYYKSTYVSYTNYSQAQHDRLTTMDKQFAWSCNTMSVTFFPFIYHSTRRNSRLSSNSNQPSLTRRSICITAHGNVEIDSDMYSALIGTIFLNLHFFFMRCIHLCFLLVCTHWLKWKTKGIEKKASKKRLLNSTQLVSTPTAHCTKIKKYCYTISTGIVIEWFPNI